MLEHLTRMSYETQQKQPWLDSSLDKWILNLDSFLNQKIDTLCLSKPLRCYFLFVTYLSYPI